MVGKCIVLLAALATINVVGPGSAHLSADAFPWLAGLLMIAAVLTCAAMWTATNPPTRRVYQSKPLNGLNRRRAAAPAKEAR